MPLKTSPLLRYRNEGSTGSNGCVATRAPPPTEKETQTLDETPQNAERNSLHWKYNNTTATPFSSDGAPPSVQELLHYRRSTHSRPGHRTDPFRLALCVEGGGMRGAVSAGMAQSLADLHYLDGFDMVYGSSAGALLGAYIVARQTACADVVVADILPSRQFVCRKRLLESVGRMVVEQWTTPSPSSTAPASHMPPAMNLSMVLDDVVFASESSEYALDMDTFVRNDRHQPLRVVVSYTNSTSGAVQARSFGTPEFGHTRRGHRTGLAACLEASMAVPAATGPLVPLQTKNAETLHAFDAFVAEPIPYVSAVTEGGATHVLALCTRPEQAPPRTIGWYERVLAPLFFHHAALPHVADAMRRGDAVDVYNQATRTVHEERSYQGAQIWGLAVPAEAPELPTTSLDRPQIRAALRAGYETVQRMLGNGVTAEPEMVQERYRVPMLATMRNWTFASA